MVDVFFFCSSVSFVCVYARAKFPAYKFFIHAEHFESTRKIACSLTIAHFRPSTASKIGCNFCIYFRTRFISCFHRLIKCVQFETVDAIAENRFFFNFLRVHNQRGILVTKKINPFYYNRKKTSLETPE